MCLKCVTSWISLWLLIRTCEVPVSSEANRRLIHCLSSLHRPLGRGFLAGRYRHPDDLKDGDMRKMQPRFQGESFYLNLKVVDAVVGPLLRTSE